MLVLGQRAPHATVDAVSQSGQVWDWRAFWGGLERGEDEFGGGKLREMGFKGRGPGGRGRREVLGCGRHRAEEGAKAKNWCRSYDEFVGYSTRRIE